MGLFGRKKKPKTSLDWFRYYARESYRSAEGALTSACGKSVSLAIKSTQAAKKSVGSIASMTVASGKAAHRSASSAMDAAGITGFHIFAVILCVLLIVAVKRKLEARRKARHLETYGEVEFPPIAPFSTRKTGRELAGSKLPLFFQECASRVGSIFQLRVPFWGGPMVVAVGEIDLAKEILKDATTKKAEKMYSSWASLVHGRPNILTSEGKPWKHSRKGISPAFATAHLDRMHKACRDKTEEWIKKRLDPMIRDNEDIDIAHEFLFLTTSIICKSAFEYRIKSREAEQVISDLEVATTEFMHNQAKDPMRASLLGSFIPSVRRAKQARRKLFQFATKMLLHYRKKPDEMRSQAKTIIGCIENSSRYASDADRVADLVMILFAGHGTTAHTLSWIFLELARNPKEARRLREALSGKDDTRAQQLLKDVLREGMRLRPVYATVAVRTLGRDWNLKHKNMVLPKGTCVIFPSSLLTRDGVEDAEDFEPMRWKAHPDKTFLSFSSGAHNCAGKGLALAEITWVLSRLCARYQFEVAEEGTPEYCVFWKCKGARLRCHKA
ncbi:unnamed protein product [Cylindrotheca closterium]|uniref:Cytochrome P450 n=1 Tax=Cylindrotheca closterium TaxID=2856 RepID=A0AAD2FB67_9STRA|nr:unnamed protein product [Cylindrotheca closterium]